MITDLPHLLHIAQHFRAEKKVRFKIREIHNGRFKECDYNMHKYKDNQNCSMFVLPGRVLIIRKTMRIFAPCFLTDASKTACLATLLKYNITIIDKYNANVNMKDRTISEPLNTKLNKLKKTNIEAFFYWYKIYKIISNK
jgi:hypothetical protein